MSQKYAVQLKGSIDIVVEFFFYGINSILYQRGIYPADSFIQKEKYGLPVLVTSQPDLKKYLDVILNQMKLFLQTKNVHKVVIVVFKSDTNEPVERWQFDVDLDSTPAKEEDQDERKVLIEIQNGIKGVIRQITASVTFLPNLEGKHTFDILLYTDKDVELPNSEWSDTTAKLINNGEHVQLKGFTTHVHKVEPIVSYVVRN